MIIAGVDDGMFKRGWRFSILAVLLHNDRLEPFEAKLRLATVDGEDATEKVIEALSSVEVDSVLVDSVTCCGFNFIDGERVYRALSTPVIHVYAYPLDTHLIARALTRLGLESRLDVIKRHWSLAHQVECPKGTLWVTPWGLSLHETAELICRLQVYSRIPLPLYNAHKLASSLSQLLQNREVKRVNRQE